MAEGSQQVPRSGTSQIPDRQLPLSYEMRFASRRE